jgi:hypothetical protein
VSSAEVATTLQVGRFEVEILVGERDFLSSKRLTPKPTEPPIQRELGFLPR